VEVEGGDGVAGREEMTVLRNTEHTARRHPGESVLILCASPSPLIVCILCVYVLLWVAVGFGCTDRSVGLVV
jgi:hypothetical protein